MKGGYAMRRAEKLVQRACNAYKIGNKYRAKIYVYILRVIYACDFSAQIIFDSSSQLVHNGLGCVFHPDTVVGKNCKIYQNVTLGGNGVIKNGKSQKGGPTLEDNVAVFAGACVLGPITIGHDSIIAANTVVTKNVPPNSLVIRNPAVIKERKFDYKF